MVLDVWKNIKKGQFSQVYLLYGTEAYLINETKQLLLQHALHEDELDFNFSQIDLEETPIETALEDVETLPFIGERRLVFLQNPFFLDFRKDKVKGRAFGKKARGLFGGSSSLFNCCFCSTL